MEKHEKKTDKHSATFISKSRVDTVHLHNQAHEIQIWLFNDFDSIVYVDVATRLLLVA